MSDFFRDHPGRLHLIAAALPLLAFVVTLIAGFSRRSRGHNAPGWADRFAAYLAVPCMLAAAGCGVLGLTWLLQDVQTYADMPATLDARWAERVDWVRVGGAAHDARPGLVLELGYRIDRLTALLFAMVGCVGTLIFVFSTAYMQDELREVEDHVAHCRRRGRYGRFFLYLSLFAFAMFLLLISDNLFQIFAGWELVGVSSFFLIGFYSERPAAGAAATKAFIVNRIGDAGFLVGLGVAWAAFGTFNIQELAGKMGPGVSGSLLTLMGLGIFAGCVGKSAQVPLHTWLPDAMEGPTPVSALIHAATMVAAGVYLAGRCFVLFTPDVLLVIAYTGAITLFVSALVAVVQTDIKKVLAFSTCSQLGYMMLALGLGGWAAGEMHLLTHAFFKALLFLAAGSVIHGLHHEQDLRAMGGLARKMPVTAYTMLIGVCAIVGVPLFSGWYSKDAILAHALGSADGHPLLFLLPAITVAITAFYMARLWLLAFAGRPRNTHAFDHAHESPLAMTGPLVILAACSVAVAWGWPVWDAEASYLGTILHAGEPASSIIEKSRHAAHESHHMALLVGLGGAAVGVFGAYTLFRGGKLLEPLPAGLGRVLFAKFYIDAVYDRLFTRPTLAIATAAGAADKRPTTTAEPAPGFDPGTLDGLGNGVGQLAVAAGRGVAPVQTGRVRGYVLVLGLTLVSALAILFGLTR